MDEIEKLTKVGLIHPNKSYREDFEDKYSFDKGSKFEEFDLKRATEKIENYSKDKRLQFWNKFYNDLKEETNKLDDSSWWNGLLFLAEKAVEIYSEDVIRGILEKGRYNDPGGQPSKDEEEILELWEKLSNDPKHQWDSGEKRKGEPVKGEIYRLIAEELGCGYSTVEQTILENTP